MKKIIIAILLGLFLTFRVQAQEVIFLPVVLKMRVTPDIDNNWRIIQPLYSKNIVLNPSAETTANFSTVATATVTRSTTFQKYGLYSYRVQPAASGDGIQLTTITATNAHHYVTLRVRGSFTTLRASLNGNLKTMVLIEKIDQNWDLYGASFGASLANGATSVQITDTASGDFYIDGVQVEAQIIWTTYIDGTQEGCASLGPVHASASERSGQSRAGGVSLDFWEEYKFQIHRIIGAGAASHNLSIDPYAALPGGELTSDKVESRDFDIIGKFITADESEFHEMRQKLEAAFQTDDNQLTRIRFNGAAVQKEIAVRYNGGLEGDIAAFYGNTEIVSNDQIMEVDLFTEDTSIQVAAPNPYWFEVGESAVDLDTNDSATFRLVAGRLKSTGQWNELGPPNAAGTYTGHVNGALAEDSTYVYYGSDFLNFDNIANADFIVRWHKADQVWSALSTGADNRIRALAVGPDGTLYAGGDFLNIGGVAANRIASWDGSAWSALGSGLNNVVHALVFGLDGTLYVGGNFTTAGGGAADRVASWDGSSWSNIGGVALGDTVFALAIGLDGTLFAGGQFQNAVDASGDGILQWDGSAWSSLSTGITYLGGQAQINALAIGIDGTLFVGGTLDLAGGETVSFICSWNGTAFDNLSSGVNNTVYTLAVGQDGVLYAGGAFTIAGGITLADRVARWNNYTWAHLDIDLPGTPTTIDILPSKFTDPVIEQIFDLFLAFNDTGTGTIAGAVTASNDGSVQAFPKIVYARSGGTTAVIETLRNEITGKELLFDYALLDGETLVIDLDPLQKTIKSSFFGSRLDAMLPNSDFGIWSLQRDDNLITSYINESGAPTLVSYMLWRDAFSGYD